MCGRVFVKFSVAQLLRTFSFAASGDVEALGNTFPRFNGAPGQDYPLIVQEPDMRGASFMRATWGLIPRWVKEAKPTVKPINAKAESVATNGMFKHAYRSRRALLPVDGFYEWKAIKGEKVKQPFALAMRDRSPFTIAAIWEKRRNPETGEAWKTFAVITCEANALVGEIHDRMPVIIAPDDRDRWLSEESDPHDLLKPFPSELMTIWPISWRVNSPANDDPSILDLLEEGPEPAK